MNDEDDCFAILENPELFDDKKVSGKRMAEDTLKPKLDVNPDRVSVTQIDDETLEKWREYFFYDDGTPKKTRDIKLRTRGQGISLYEAAKELLEKGTSHLSKDDKIQKIFEVYGVSSSLASKEANKEEEIVSDKVPKSAKRLDLEGKVQKLSFLNNEPKSIEELEQLDIDELDALHTQYSATTVEKFNNKGELLFMYIHLYGRGVESISPSIGLNCEGLCQFYDNSKDDIISVLTEFIIENPQIEKLLSPQVRMLFYLVITPISISLKNSL